MGQATTDANGNYLVRGLPAGDYRVFIESLSTTDAYLTQYYDRKPAASNANLVAVATTTRTGIDFVLDERLPYYLPYLTSPVASTSDNPPLLVWPAISGAATYELKVDDLTAGTPDLIHELNLTTNQFRPAQVLTVNHEYEVRLRAANSAGSAQWGPAAWFRQLALPVFVLAVTTNGPGHVVLNPTGGSYPFGTEVCLTAVDENGSSFDSWTGNISDRFSAVTWITMTNDQQVTATFAPNRAPPAPANVLPASGATGIAVAATLTASAFSDPDSGDSHGASGIATTREHGPTGQRPRSLR